MLLSDLNSNVPVTIAPQNIQAIITGSGDNIAQIKYIKKGISEELTDESIVYTSGTGAIFKSGIPIGKVRVIENDQSKKFYVEFYTDFSQLKYVFAEIITKTELEKAEQQVSDNQQNPIDAKLKLLEDELAIIEESNSKFKNENENLKAQINVLNNKIILFQNETNIQKETIKQYNIDTEELEFLRLNLIYSQKCQSRKLFSSGFKVGTPEYKQCTL